MTVKFSKEGGFKINYDIFPDHQRLDLQYFRLIDIIVNL